MVGFDLPTDQVMEEKVIDEKFGNCDCCGNKDLTYRLFDHTKVDTIEYICTKCSMHAERKAEFKIGKKEKWQISLLKSELLRTRAMYEKKRIENRKTMRKAVCVISSLLKFLKIK